MGRRTGWGQLKRARNKYESELVPVLGSGFVTQAVFEGSQRPGARPRPAPVDWYSLLGHISKDLDLPDAAALIHRAVPGQTTLLWDAMVTELASAARTGKAAHKCERVLRLCVAKRLRDDAATNELSRPFVESFLALGWKDVVSFNFDRVLSGKARPVYLTHGDSKRASLAAARPHGGARIWYPHGHESDPESIVLGAHAYGVRIGAMQAAFDEHASGRRKRATEPKTWVATALERPLLFVGLSLTREEWTTWWLLSQRLRFWARRDDRPPVFVFARRPSPDDSLEAQGTFQTLHRACEVLKLTLLETHSHEEGWWKLKKALAWE